VEGGRADEKVAGGGGEEHSVCGGDLWWMRGRVVVVVVGVGRSKDGDSIISNERERLS
jgi:hypothetical protein